MKNIYKYEIIEGYTCDLCKESSGKDENQVYSCPKCDKCVCINCYNDHIKDCFLKPKKTKKLYMCKNCIEIYEKIREAENCCQ